MYQNAPKDEIAIASTTIPTINFISCLFFADAPSETFVAICIPLLVNRVIRTCVANNALRIFYDIVFMFVYAL